MKHIFGIFLLGLLFFFFLAPTPAMAGPICEGIECVGLTAAIILYYYGAYIFLFGGGIIFFLLGLKKKKLLRVGLVLLILGVLLIVKQGFVLYMLARTQIEVAHDEAKKLNFDTYTVSYKPDQYEMSAGPMRYYGDYNKYSFVLFFVEKGPNRGTLQVSEYNVVDAGVQNLNCGPVEPGKDISNLCTLYTVTPKGRAIYISGQPSLTGDLWLTDVFVTLGNTMIAMLDLRSNRPNFSKEEIIEFVDALTLEQPDQIITETSQQNFFYKTSEPLFVGFFCWDRKSCWEK